MQYWALLLSTQGPGSAEYWGPLLNTQVLLSTQYWALLLSTQVPQSTLYWLPLLSTQDSKYSGPQVLSIGHPYEVLRTSKYFILDISAKCSILGASVRYTGSWPPCEIPLGWFTAWSLTLSSGLYQGRVNFSPNGPHLPCLTQGRLLLHGALRVTVLPSRHLTLAWPLTCLHIPSMTICQPGPPRLRVVFDIKEDSGWGSPWGSWL